MSLRIVHIIFIIAATLTAFGFGAWGIAEYGLSGESTDMAMGIGSIVVGALLIFYGNRFFKKLKTLKSVNTS